MKATVSFLLFWALVERVYAQAGKYVFDEDNWRPPSILGAVLTIAVVWLVLRYVYKRETEDEDYSERVDKLAQSIINAEKNKIEKKVEPGVDYTKVPEEFLLRNLIKARMHRAMKAKDTARLQVIRMLMAKINQYQKESGSFASDDAVKNIVKKMINECEETKNAGELAVRDDIVGQATFEISVLEECLVVLEF